MSTMIGVINDRPLINWSWWDEQLGPLWSQNHLIKRGWTMRQIKTALGEPDAFGCNPRGGAYVRLFSRARVWAVEKERAA